MIREIFKLCNRPSPACDNLIKQIKEGELFQNEIDLGSALIQIDTDEDDNLRDLFPEQWLIHFYPQNMVENFLIRNELLELGDKIKERSAPSHPIYALADEYLKKFHELLEYATKYGYDGLPCYMVVYRIMGSEMNLFDVFTTKPCVVLDFLKSQKNTAV